MDALAKYGVTHERGFLPVGEPLQKLPPAYAAWDELGRELPKLLVAGKVAHALSGLPELDPKDLKDGPEIERAMVILSFTGHALVWGAGVSGGGAPVERIPACLARPWAAIAERLGRPPVLSYASYALHNWRRIDPAGPIAAGNIALLQNFYGGVDEEWFVIIHVDIEARANGVIQAVTDIHTGLGSRSGASAPVDVPRIEQGLRNLDTTLGDMYAVLERMPEYCDPYIYFRRVRPYIFGWKNQPSLPKGVLYEGVERFGGAPQKFRGETGAQSGIIPVCDALLGVTHKEDELRVYLNEMRDYMPAPHRAYLSHVEQGPSVREFLEKGGQKELKALYDSCINWMDRFRSLHLEYAIRYIANQAQQNATNPSQIGTGGTPFVDYLRKHRDETSEHKLQERNRG